MLRTKCIANIAVGLLAGLVAFVSPARADSFVVDLTISYNPASIPGNPISPDNLIIPGFEGTQLGGTASFFTTIDGIKFNPTSMFNLSPLISVGGVFSMTFEEPPDPCIGAIGAAACQLYFSFGGQATRLDVNGMATSFGAAALLLVGDITYAGVPVPPPTLQIGALDFSLAAAPIIDVTGPIVAFDDPVVVGTWDVTISETPLPAALPLFATGLSALGLLGWRRKRKAQAA